MRLKLALMFWCALVLPLPLWAQGLGSGQLVVVSTSDWPNVQGTLNAYEWNARQGRWRLALGPWPVVVGSKGMAWGAGLHEVALHSGPAKREGDKKAPAGIFPLLGAFAYNPKALGKMRIPVTEARQWTQCVDDPASAYYNQLVEADRVPQPDWKSHEDMRRRDALYKYGLVVGYNTAPNTQSGGGSCIFFHLWQNPQTGTLGCTAMSEPHILKLLRWLNGDQKPLLVQAPAAAYQALQKKYGLP